MLPCDQRSEDEQVADLNAALEDDLDGIRGLIAGVLWSVVFWAVLALVVIA